jgi:hypothetical protein
MGYYPYHTNTFAAMIYEGNYDGPVDYELDEAFENRIKEVNKELIPLRCRMSLMAEDGSDSRVSCDGVYVFWYDYTSSTEFAENESDMFDDDKCLNGDTKGKPTQEEIDKVKAIVLKHGFPWNEPERSKRSYIL